MKKLPLGASMIALALGWLCQVPSFAQITLQSVVSLAVQNSPRVQMSLDDLHRATAALSETKDAYIPTLGLGGGLGRSYGISLAVPTIVTVNSQSLVYGPAQRSVIRAARENVQASTLALQDVSEQVKEDAALAYISLDQAYTRRKVLAEELLVARKLFDVTQQRATAGVDSEMEVKKSKRTMLQIELQQPQVENDIAVLQEHLFQLTGLPGVIDTIASSVPAQPPAIASDTSPVNAGILASQTNAKARAELASGDSRYALRPQIYMQAQYGRISPINNVSDYYNLNGHYNTMLFGVSIQLPLFDKVHAARARETAADAQHARHEAQSNANQQRENQLKLQGSLKELAMKAELAKLDWDIARDQLAATVTEVQSRSTDLTGGRQLTVRDEMSARLDEAQRQLDWLDAALLLHRTQITVSRLNGTLTQWLNCADPASAGCTPATVPPRP